MISIVITTYNRINLVCGAIDSALAFLGEPLIGEIIVVDDHSHDDTLCHLKKKYSNEIESKHIKIIPHLQNRGVTSAKNTGAAMANQDWIMFLDSDDQLIQESRESLLDTLRQTAESIPIVFFRCIDQRGRPIGAQMTQPIFQNLQNFIKYGTYGESLPVVRTHHFNKVAYREDLRGFESLAYCKLVKQHGRGMVSPLTVRIYETVGSDRLSTRKNLLKRGCLLAKGYMSLLIEYHKDLPVSSSLNIASKILVNSVRCIIGKFVH